MSKPTEVKIRATNLLNYTTKLQHNSKNTLYTTQLNLNKKSNTMIQFETRTYLINK